MPILRGHRDTLVLPNGFVQQTGSVEFREPLSPDEEVRLKGYIGVPAPGFLRKVETAALGATRQVRWWDEQVSTNVPPDGPDEPDTPIIVDQRRERCRSTTRA